MASDWTARFSEMRASFYDGPPEAVARARAFYEEMVGSPAIVALTVALRLPLTEGGQDWAIEIADADRLEELLDFYETVPLEREERGYLLELIVATLEEALQYPDPDAALIARFQRHLLKAFPDHRETVAYWARLEDEGQGRFALSPLMREIWALGHADG